MSGYYCIRSIMVTQLCCPDQFAAADKALHIVLLLFLFLCKSLLVSCCRPGEYKINDICCPMCSAGTVVKSHCTATSGSIVCLPCVEGTYMDHPNGLTECFRCKECDSGTGLTVKEKCSYTSNTVCECLPGLYCENRDSCDICIPHKVCKSGEFVKEAGSPTTNTVCEACPHGYFSNKTMAKECTPWKKCGPSFKEGTSTSDSECGRHRFVIFASIFSLIIIIIIIIITWINIRFTSAMCVRREKSPTEETGRATEMWTR